MENISVDLNNLSQSERDDLMKLIKKANKKTWDGPSGEWYIMGWGGIRERENCGSHDDHKRMGHCGKTQEQAEYIRDQLTHYAWMLHAWLEIVGDWRPNWSDNKSKFHVFWDTSSFGVDINSICKHNHGFHFQTQEQAQQFIEMVGDRIVELGK